MDIITLVQINATADAIAAPSIPVTGINIKFRITFKIADITAENKINFVLPITINVCPLGPKKEWTTNPTASMLNAEAANKYSPP